MVENWNFEEQCIPLSFISLFNLTDTKDKTSMKVCQDQESGKDNIETYNQYVAPYLTQHCNHLCEKLNYRGSMQATVPESAPIEVCYWLGSNDVTYSEEYLIYDLKVILGSVGGTTSLLLGFLWNTILRKIFGAIKASIRK